MRICGVIFAIIVAVGCSSTTSRGTTTKPTDRTTDRPVTIQTVAAGTPQACLDALDSAEKMIGIAGDFATSTGTFVGALSTFFSELANGDLSGANVMTDATTTFTDEVNGGDGRIKAEKPGYQSAAAECRAG